MKFKGLCPNCGTHDYEVRTGAPSQKLLKAPFPGEPYLRRHIVVLTCKNCGKVRSKYLWVIAETEMFSDADPEGDLVVNPIEPDVDFEG